MTDKEKPTETEIPKMSGIVCPFCGFLKSSAIKSENTVRGIRRVRRCGSGQCGLPFATLEVVTESAD